MGKADHEAWARRRDAETQRNFCTLNADKKKDYVREEIWIKSSINKISEKTIHFQWMIFPRKRGVRNLLEKFYLHFGEF